MSARECALRVIHRLITHFEFVEKPKDSQWNKLKETDQCECVVSSDDALVVIEEAERMLALEDNLLYIPSPAMACGDIHGQFLDLLQLLHLTNGWDLLQQQQTNSVSFPHSTTLPCMCPISDRFSVKFLKSMQTPHFDFNGHNYLFLGDYVDRGSFSAEVIILLMSLKVLHPKKVFLLRGNHESRSMTTHLYDDGFNFKEECFAKYGGDVVYEACMKCFDALPLAAIVESTTGRWFCAHGGLGPKITCLDDIRGIPRRREPPITGPMCDLLWADPLLEEVLGYAMKDEEYEEFLELDFLPNPPRGCSHLFGYPAIMEFIKSSKIVGIVRAHQCKEEGISYHYNETRFKSYPFPLVTTIFSAPNYCGTHSNKAAVLVFGMNNVQVLKYDDLGSYTIEEIPHIDSPTDSLLPPTPTLTLDHNPLTTDSDPEVSPVLRHRVRALSRPEAQLLTPEVLKLREEKRKKMRRNSINVLARDGVHESGSEAFQQAVRRDSIHECHPGWQSLRRMTGVIGRLQSIRKKTSVKSLPDVNETTPTSPTNSLSSNLLEMVKDQDMNQMRHVFNSIDVDNDGHLSLSEMRKFAIDVSDYCEQSLSEADQLMGAMDKDNDGRVSFEEFTSYMSKLQIYT